MADIYTNVTCRICGKAFNVNEIVTITKNGRLDSYHSSYYQHPDTPFFHVNFTPVKKAVPNAEAFHTECIRDIINKHIKQTANSELVDSVIKEITDGFNLVNVFKDGDK
jgi:hypothetical protein